MLQPHHNTNDIPTQTHAFQNAKLTTAICFKSLKNISIRDLTRNLKKLNFQHHKQCFLPDLKAVKINGAGSCSQVIHQRNIYKIYLYLA